MLSRITLAVAIGFFHLSSTPQGPAPVPAPTSPDLAGIGCQQEGKIELLRRLRRDRRHKEAEVESLKKDASGDEINRGKIKVLQDEVAALEKSIGHLIPEVLQELLNDLKGGTQEAHPRTTARLAEVGTPAVPGLERLARSGPSEGERERADAALNLIRDVGAVNDGLWYQWAGGAEASSEWNENARMACGEPDSQRPGDGRTSWASREPDGGKEWLELAYRAAVRPVHIRIYESFNPGAIVRVEAQDAGRMWQVLWKGKSGRPKAPACMDVRLDRPSFATRVLRITLDTARVKGSNQIDAVQLIGEPTGEAVPLADPAKSEYSEMERWEFVGKNLKESVDKGLEALRAMQMPSGVFEGPSRHAATALAVYTFLASGKTPADPAPAKALDWLLNNPFSKSQSGYETYEISLVAVAMSYALPQIKPKAVRNRASSTLQKAADWLAAAQRKDGGWSYRAKGEGHDHSNGQFAILGLRAAANGGATIDKEVWERELRHYRTSQVKDGGWVYSDCDHAGQGDRRSHPGMTAAGIMGTALALGSVGKEQDPESLAADVSIRRGLAALKNQWAKGVAQAAPDFYVLYSIERACMLTGQRLLGDVDWYLEGAWKLLRRQHENGRWMHGTDPVSQCFALLFLHRAYVPVPTPSNAK